MSVAVVIPTYNERQNLEPLVGALFALAIPDLAIIVVDDNSPDGTGLLADQLAARHANVTVVHRAKKAGLGPAYIAGFQLALASPVQYIVAMDADLSHSPQQLPILLQAAASADVILGSRYVAGGKIENWNSIRRLISRFGNQYARAVLGLPYHDLTGGFKCYRRSVLAALDFGQLSSTGYNFQIETTYAAHRQDARIVEVPITFTERQRGASKFSAAILLESFWKVLRLRFQHLSSDRA